MPGSETSTVSQFQHPKLIMYPTYGHFHEREGLWRLHVAGQTSLLGPDNIRRAMLLRILQRLLRATREELQQPIFQRRVSGFLVASRKGCAVSVQLGETERLLRRRSRRNGHFRDILRLTEHELDQLRTEGAISGNQVNYFARELSGDEETTGSIHLVERTGCSVVSDIDDTIKHSQVLSRQTMLRNTFLEPFSAVPGMSEVYKRWEAAGASFHYVSSSPWQLYMCLHEMLAAEGFPPGSFHLRPLRLRDSSFVRWFVNRRRIKGRIIRGLIRTFPRRSFILVGDSSERDPEIYGRLARRFPRQVSRVLIRRVPGQEIADERWLRAFRNVPPAKWQLFESPTEISD